MKRVKQFEFLINENRTLNQAALAYILTKDEISTCIPGAKSIEQLESNILSKDIELNQIELNKINEIQNSWNE